MGSKRRAISGGAVEDDRLRLVARLALDARLEMAARDVDRAGDVPGLVLVVLAHVDQQRPGAVAVRDGIVDLPRVHLPDLLLYLADQLRAAGHPRIS